MKIVSTNHKSKLLEDPSFLDSYYKNLRKVTQKALDEQSRWLKIASVYIDDGMTEEECSELLAIDGLPKDVALRYAKIVAENGNPDQNVYSFEFENVYGEVLSSEETRRFVYASNEEEAWNSAKLLIENEMQDYEPDHVISVKCYEK